MTPPPGRGSALTEYQSAVAGVTDDLAVGYPTIRSRTEAAARIVTSLAEPVQSWPQLRERLTGAIGNLLDLPLTPADAFFTFSGTSSISRVLHALCADKPGRILTTEPTFDSIPALIREASGQEPLIVRKDVFAGWGAVVGELLAAIRESRPTAVFLVSPDNPTGAVLDEDSMRAIAGACGAVGAVLVVDQCFALVSPFCTQVPLVPLVDGLAEWCLLWDSSKTVELLGERVGLVHASHGLRGLVERSVGVLQLELPLATAAAVARELETLESDGYLDELHATIRTNVARLSAMAASLELRTSVPDAGSLQVIGLAGSAFDGRAAELCRQIVLGYGVAVTYDSLFSTGTTGHGQSFVRVSTATPPAAVERFCAAIQDLLA